MAFAPITENRKLCEMYRTLQFAHSETRRVSYRHHPAVEEDERSRDYIAMQFCLEAGYIEFFRRTGPEFAGDPSQPVSHYQLTWAGELFLDRYRSRDRD